MLCTTKAQLAMVLAKHYPVITLPDLTVPSQCNMFASLPDEYKIDSLLYSNISIFSISGMIWLCLTCFHDNMADMSVHGRPACGQMNAADTWVPTDLKHEECVHLFTWDWTTLASSLVSSFQEDMYFCIFHSRTLSFICILLRLVSSRQLGSTLVGLPACFCTETKGNQV